MGNETALDRLFEWKQYPNAIHVISTGAGVQSSTLCEMAETGEISPKPIAGVFGDTQAEPASVYAWLKWLEGRLSFPIHTVTKGSLVTKELTVTRSKRSGKMYRHNKIPLYTEETEEVPCSCAHERQDAIDRGEDPEEVIGCEKCDNTGKVVRSTKRMMPRMCTMDFKIKPVIRKVREICGVPRGCKEVRVVQWIGISYDEYLRGKPSQVPWIVNRWPLLETKTTRQDCLQYWEERKLPKPPKSACSFCPYHNDQEWKRLKEFEPVEFAKAVDFERRVQKAATKSEVSTGVPFLHRSLVPLDNVQFSDNKSNGFQNECVGMCGV
jgi:hypothetical protein